jgi:uroporphyrinogen-III synthase
VKNYVSLLGIRSGKSKLVSGVLNASIGPITSETLRDFELSVDMQAQEYTIPGLLSALVDRAKEGVPAPPVEVQQNEVATV